MRTETLAFLVLVGPWAILGTAFLAEPLGKAITWIRKKTNR